MDDSTSAIVLDDLSLSLGGRPVLDGLSARLDGPAIGLLGPNGAGKTTLLRTLLGFFTPDRGDATLLGRSLLNHGREIRARIGYMPENDGHIAGMSAVRFVRLMAELSGLPHRAALERAHETLFYVGLDEARYRLLGTYSTGMKQRVKLAQALVHGPRLVLLDEPTDGLDPPARARMLGLIRDLRDRGATVLLSSHLLHDVEQVCDRVLILKSGRVAALCDLEAERRAERALIDVEVLGDINALTDALTAAGCTVSRTEGQRMRLVLPEGVTSLDLYRAADRVGAAFRRLDSARSSLKQLFLAAMEGPDGGV